MKSRLENLLWSVAVFMGLLMGGIGTAYGHNVVIGDPEEDLGILLSAGSGNCATGNCREALVLDPEKLALFGLTGVSKGNKIRIVHQVNNLFRIEFPDGKPAVKIRLKFKSESEKWPFPNHL